MFTIGKTELTYNTMDKDFELTIEARWEGELDRTVYLRAEDAERMARFILEQLKKTSEAEG